MRQIWTYQSARRHIEAGTVPVTVMLGCAEAETLHKPHEWNQSIHRVRSRVEKLFGPWKRSYGLR